MSTTERLSNQTISQLCSSLAVLLHAGVGVADGLALLAQEEPDPQQKELLNLLSFRTDEGVSLAQAMAESGRFPDYVTGLLAVGEQSGRTEEALSALARHYEDRSRLDQQLHTALLSPVILLVIMTAVVAVLLVHVLPVFEEVYASFGGTMTGLAALMVSFGQLLGRAMPLLLPLLAAAAVAMTVLYFRPSLRSALAAAWRSRFGDRGFLHQLNTARLAQALSMGLSSGLTFEESLSLSSGIMSSIPAAQTRCRSCLEQLEEGGSLARAMEDSDLLPLRECRLLTLGLQSGSGDHMMADIAQRLTEESELAMVRHLSRIEPALVGVACLLVGMILLAVMMPLLQIMTTIG